MVAAFSFLETAWGLALDRCAHSPGRCDQSRSAAACSCGVLWSLVGLGMAFLIVLAFAMPGIAIGGGLLPGMGFKTLA